MSHRKLTYVAQAIAALLLLWASFGKFMGGKESVAVFTRLGMEPTGRYLIAVIELTAALLLLSPQAASGSALAFGVMCGTVLAHLTQLGLSVNGDGGRMAGMLAVVLIMSGYVLVARRRELPLVGETFR